MGHSQPGQHTSLSLFQALLGHLKGHPHVPAETLVPQPRAQDQVSKCLCWHLPLLHPCREQGCPAINQPCSCSVSAAIPTWTGWVRGWEKHFTDSSILQCSGMFCLSHMPYPSPGFSHQAWKPPCIIPVILSNSEFRGHHLQLAAQQPQEAFSRWENK